MLFLLRDAVSVNLCSSWLAALFALKWSPQKLDTSRPELYPLLFQICVFSMVFLISPLFCQKISSVIPQNGPCFSLQAILPLCLHVSVSKFPFYERTESCWIQLTLKTLFYLITHINALLTIKSHSEELQVRTWISFSSLYHSYTHSTALAQLHISSPKTHLSYMPVFPL